MATYYRWRRYTKAFESDDRSFEAIFHNANSYSINCDKFIIGTGIDFNTNTGKYSLETIEEEQNISDGESITRIVEAARYSPTSPNIDRCIIFQSSDGDYSSFGVHEIAIVVDSGSDQVDITRTGTTTKIHVETYSGSGQFTERLSTGPIAGTLLDYVYSTNASAYPNGGVSGDYYYDQRTTVQSPTAPSNITSPNPITTTSVTVSWSAATSNTNYPVNLYELSYAIGYADSWTVVGTTSGTSMEVTIPAGTTSIRFRVRARDSNGQWGEYATSGTAIPIYLAPTLTVPPLAMQGQSIAVNWTSIEGAGGYTLERKSSADADWTQVYSGTALTYSETAGTWTSVQYRVQAVFDGTPGGWATSAEIPVVSASALVISGQDGDLGTLVNDVPYSISTDTGNQITATVRVNGSLLFSGTVVSGAAMAIPVLDLPTGDGTIVIEASVMSGSSMVTAMRTWTYDKTISGFANHGSTAKLQKDGKYIWPDTIAEAVRMQGGITLDRFIASTVITLTTSGWDQSGGIYKQTVDCPVVWPYAPIIVIDPDLNGEDQDADDSILEAWQSGPGAKGMKQGDGTITFFSASQPTMNIPVRVGVI